MTRYALLLLPPLLAGCGDDAPPTGEVPLDPASCAGDGADYSDCDLTLAPGDDDAKSMQTALIEAQAGDHICFCPGTYRYDSELSLTVSGVTLKGIGATRDDVIFDFADQATGDDALTVTSDAFTITSLWLKNTPGNGVMITGAEDVRIADVHASWDAGSVTENGAYALYPVKSKRVLIEDCEVEGAADAGIYVGQSEQALVRNNLVHGNVAGIEFENTTDCEAYGNEAYDNTAGILVFVLPKLEKKDGMRCKVHDNHVYDNNRDNFAESGTVVASAPPGTGMLLLAPDQTEIHDNVIEDNDSTGIVVVSYTSIASFLPGGTSTLDPETDPWVETTYIHDNTFAGNGQMPMGLLAQLGLATLEDVLWDGAENPDAPGSAEFCLGLDPPSFRSTGGAEGIVDPSLHTTDPTPYMCEGQVQASVDL